MIGIMKEVVSAVFIDEENNILTLKRSPHKKYYPNLWDTVVGKKEQDETVNECLRREVQEELGNSDFEVKKQTEKMVYRGGEHEWCVTLFLCKLKNNNIRLNEEHTEYR